MLLPRPGSRVRAPGRPRPTPARIKTAVAKTVTNMMPMQTDMMISKSWKPPHKTSAAPASEWTMPHTIFEVSGSPRESNPPPATPHAVAKAPRPRRR